MTCYFTISVTLLDAEFHGWTETAPEWPPSPLRLFQALLAGAKTGCRSAEWTEATAEAFRWLEMQAPPLIVAPGKQLSRGYTRFVPNNDSDKEPVRERRLTGKETRPNLLRDEAVIHYLWAVDEAAVGGPWARHIEILRTKARQLFTLGWGIDSAIGDARTLSSVEASRLTGIRWRPSVGRNASGALLRSPVADSLRDLEDVHRSFCESVDGKLFKPRRKPAVFETVHYLRETSMPARRYVCFEFSDEVAFRQENVAAVAAMLRSLTCEAAKADTHEFPGGSEIYVAGHAKGHRATPPRFSYIPLPTIGHDFADGMIRRLLVVEPYGGDGSHAEWAGNRLKNAALTDEGGAQRAIILDPWRPLTSVWPRYLGEAVGWSSVTPVILPGHDDHDPRKKAPELFLKAVKQAGIPLASIEDFRLRKAPHWPGSQHPRQYQRPDYLKHLPGWHVWIRFREPIAGPLAIGAGRHCGLGVFASED